MQLRHPIKSACSIISRYLRRHDREQTESIDTQIQHAADVRSDAMKRLHALDAEARSRGMR